MTLTQYIKSKGIRNVKTLAEFLDIRPETINRWWKEEDKRENLLEPAIARYLEAKK